VDVNVGTPPQKFELVADTGSDAVIVTSCVCVDQGFCAKDDKCFRGTNRSKTFAMADMPDAGNHTSGPMGVSMTFGSGTVTSIIATDIVEVAGMKAKMDKGLLLMVDRRSLAISGQFEGILGLGPSHKNDTKKGVSLHEKGMRPVVQAPAAHGARQSQLYAPRHFSDNAHVERFSICFNDADKPGALNFNEAPFEKPIPAIGQAHWGLGVYGISVGSSASTEKVVACSNTEMQKGQETPCGGIPDSGTTLLMGPAKQIEALFGSLCESWGRCQEARQSKFKDMSASHAFQHLLYDCASWMTDEKGIDEVPSVFFTMGSGDHQQKLELTSWAYIVETMQPVFKKVTKYLFGVIPVEINKPTSKIRKVCTPSFGVQQYQTIQNGPVWILGTPFFYQFKVGYSFDKPSISFLSQKCSYCNETKSSFISSQEVLHRSNLKPPRRMRSVNSEPRVPYFDTSIPL